MVSIVLTSAIWGENDIDAFRGLLWVLNFKLVGLAAYSEPRLAGA